MVARAAACLNSAAITCCVGAAQQEDGGDRLQKQGPHTRDLVEGPIWQRAVAILLVKAMKKFAWTRWKVAFSTYIDACSRLILLNIRAILERPLRAKMAFLHAGSSLG
jgi:hypothetical protein